MANNIDILRGTTWAHFKNENMVGFAANEASAHEDERAAGCVGLILGAFSGFFMGFMTCLLLFGLK